MIKKYFVLHPPEENIHPINLDRSFTEENSARMFLRQSSSLATIRWTSSKMDKALHWWGKDISTRHAYSWMVERILTGQFRYPNYQGTKFVIGRDDYDSDKYLS